MLHAATAERSKNLQAVFVRLLRQYAINIVMKPKPNLQHCTCDSTLLFLGDVDCYTFGSKYSSHSRLYSTEHLAEDQRLSKVQSFIGANDIENALETFYIADNPKH